MIGDRMLLHMQAHGQGAAHAPAHAGAHDRSKLAVESLCSILD
jgi:hypothetical protein